MVLKVMIGRGIDGGEGGWKSWSKDASHRADSKRRGIFRDIWTDRDGPLPWRLTAEELKLLDERLGDVVWPHYVDRMHYDGCSFWKKPSRLWKTNRKVPTPITCTLTKFIHLTYNNIQIRQVVLLYFILATQLRDQLSRLRVALFTIIWALRRLDGQVYSYEDAKRLGVLPGSHCIDPSEIEEIHRDLIIGLCLLEGCLPVFHLHPALHHVVHFAQYTMSHGCLRSLWMMYFER